MTPDDPRRAALWMWLHIAVILSSAAIILYPPIRHFAAFFIPVAFVLMPVYFFMTIDRVRRDGTGNIPLGELHAQVKRGRRFSTSALEWAAVVALLLSTFYLSSGPG